MTAHAWKRLDVGQSFQLSVMSLSVQTKDQNADSRSLSGLHLCPCLTTPKTSTTIHAVYLCSIDMKEFAMDQSHRHWATVPTSQSRASLEWNDHTGTQGCKWDANGI